MCAGIPCCFNQEGPIIPLRRPAQRAREARSLCPRSNHEIEQQADAQFSIFQSYQSRLKARPPGAAAAPAAVATALVVRTALLLPDTCLRCYRQCFGDAAMHCLNMSSLNHRLELSSASLGVYSHGIAAAC